MIRSLVFSLVATVLLAGCTGTVVHKKITYGTDGKPSESADKYPAGVPFRLATSRMVYWTYTTRTGVNGTMTSACQPQLQAEIWDNVPSDEKYVISYDSAPFESSKMQVVLNDNGTLRSVNVDSTPLSPENIIKAAVEAGKVLKSNQDTQDLASGTEEPACTAEKHIVGRCGIEDNDCLGRMQGHFNKWKMSRPQPRRARGAGGTQLSRHEANILRALENAQKSLTHTELSASLAPSQQELCDYVGGLEEKGLVRVDKLCAPSQHSSASLCITKKGRSVLKSLEED